MSGTVAELPRSMGPPSGGQLEVAATRPGPALDILRLLPMLRLLPRLPLLLSSLHQAQDALDQPRHEL